MVLAKVEKMELYEEELSETDRNTGGFGHTGTN
jgi:dUTPase